MKTKADIVIYGNLLSNDKIISMGGGNLYSSYSKEELINEFDITDACIINGDLHVDSFNAGNLCVVVCGALSVEGGYNGAF